MFAVRIVRLCEALPHGKTTDVISKQLLRCGTSVGANYRAANRAKSNADFIAKMGIVEEECDECLYWMQLLVDLELIAEKRLTELMKEAHEILAMTVTSIKTARNKQSAERGVRSKESAAGGVQSAENGTHGNTE